MILILQLSWISAINDTYYSWYLGGFFTSLPDLVLSLSFCGVDTGELCFPSGLGFMVC